MLRLGAYLFPEAGVVIDGERVAEDLDRDLVVEPGDALHEVGGGVVAEVRGQVADAQSYSSSSSSSSAGSQSLGECVGCFVECGHLRERETEVRKEGEERELAVNFFLHE